MEHRDSRPKKLASLTGLAPDSFLRIMTKYAPTGEAVRKMCRQTAEDQKGTGSWLNEKSMQFDKSYRLIGKSLELVKEIGVECKIAARKDTTGKLEIIIANLLRYRDWRPIEMALNTSESTMSRLVHKLVNLKFLDFKIGYSMNDIARYSRVWPTKKLLDYFEKVHSPDIIIVIPFRDLVVLKDENKNPITYTDTAQTSKIKKILSKANDVNRNAEIIYRNKPVSTGMVAIFNRKFTLYGRLHTKGCYHYQGFSEDKRGEITINGNEVVELDFSALHPHLLYASEKLQLEDEPYSIVPNAPELRGFLKRCLLPLLNSKGGKIPGCWVEQKGRKRYYRKAYWRTAEANAEGGINQRINENQELRELLKEHSITKARQIIDLFKKAHAPIAHHFCSDSDNGLRMMNKDASIALDVVEHFTSKGVPILAIHDSFIVQKQYRDELYNVMDLAYKKHSGGFTCPIK